MLQTITIQKSKYETLKKKANFVDNILLQLDASLNDAEAGKIKPAKH